MPVGLFGVMAAALMAALMGNLASASNSIATLFSYDLYRRFRPATPGTPPGFDRPARLARRLSAGHRTGAVVGQLQKHFRRHQRHHRAHRAADFLCLRRRRLLAARLGLQRQVDDVDRLAHRRAGLHRQDAARLATRRVRLDSGRSFTRPRSCSWPFTCSVSASCCKSS